MRRWSKYLETLCLQVACLKYFSASKILLKTLQVLPSSILIFVPVFVSQSFGYDSWNEEKNREMIITKIIFFNMSACLCSYQLCFDIEMLRKKIKQWYVSYFQSKGNRAIIMIKMIVKICQHACVAANCAHTVDCDCQVSAAAVALQIIIHHHNLNIFLFAWYFKCLADITVKAKLWCLNLHWKDKHC